MIVAPNSPSARAQLMTSPAARAPPARGTEMRRKTSTSDAPSTRAASSRSPSTAASPARALRMKNGAETNTWARITATVLNAISTPEHGQRLAQQPAPPEHEQQGQPGHRWRQDDGQVDDGLDQPLPGEPPPDEHDRQGQADGHGHDQADRGRGQAQAEGAQDGVGAEGDAQRAVQHGPADEDRDGQPQERGQQDGQGQQRGRTRAAVLARATGHDGGGRNPNPARTAWPSAPTSQSRKACAGIDPGGGADHDPGVGRRDVDLGRAPPRPRPRRWPRRVGRVDDAGVTLAELDLGHDRGHVVLARHDVGLVGRGEVGRVASEAGQVGDELAWRTG